MCDSRRLRPDRAERGFALLIVLWTIGLLALIGITLTAAGRIEVKRAANLRYGAVAEAGADGAVFQAILRLARGEWRPDAGAHAAHVGAVLAEIRLEDETRKVNPNLASQSEVEALLRSAGVEAGRAGVLAEAIVEWRTPVPPAAPGSARITQYRAAGLLYGPPGRPFTSLDELGLVLGMTPGLLARLKPNLSIYNGSPNTHPDDDAHSGQRTVEAARPATPDGFQVVGVLVQALGPGQSRFTRRVIIRVNRTPGPRETAFLILAWEETVD